MSAWLLSGLGRSRADGARWPSGKNLALMQAADRWLMAGRGSDPDWLTTDQLKDRRKHEVYGVFRGSEIGHEAPA